MHEGAVKIFSKKTTVFLSDKGVVLIIKRNEFFLKRKKKDNSRGGSASRIANANWNPDNSQLNVNANNLGNSNDNLGCRLSRSLANAKLT